MATPILDATAGGINSNTYATLAEALEYFDTQLYRDDFVNADEDIQNRSLLMATRILDEQWDWKGFKYVYKSALRWPRSGVLDPDNYDVYYETIPQFLKNATAELAGHLIANNRTEEDDTKGFKEMQAGTLRLVIDKSDRKQVTPDSVYEILKFYGRLETSETGDLLRV